MKIAENTETSKVPSVRGFAVLRFITGVAVGLAVCSAIILVSLRVIHCFQPGVLPWKLKSAIPLILVGAAFAFFQFSSRRTRKEILLGLMVAAAFILWGAEQYVSNPAVASFIDDIVVFLFVMDLSIVIYGHLKSGASPVGDDPRTL